MCSSRNRKPGEAKIADYYGASFREVREVVLSICCVIHCRKALLRHLEALWAIFGRLGLFWVVFGG